MGEQEVQQRRKLEEILQELVLTASFREKAQARCSPSASVSDYLSSGSLLSSSILLISSPHQDQIPPPHQLRRVLGRRRPAYIAINATHVYRCRTSPAPAVVASSGGTAYTPTVAPPLQLHGIWSNSKAVPERDQEGASSNSDPSTGAVSSSSDRQQQDLGNKKTLRVGIQ